MRLIIISLLISINISAQSDISAQDRLKVNSENFEYFITIENPNALQLDSLIELSISYSFINEDSCLILGLSAVEKSEKISDPSIRAKALVELGDSYRIFGRLNEGKDLLEQGKAIYERLGKEGEVATANNKLGALNVNQGNFEVAINYYLSALETWENLKDSQNIIKPYINIGAVFRNLNQNEKALEYYSRALEWADILDDDRARMYVYNNQAIIFNAKATEYQNQMDKDSSDSAIMLDSIKYYTNKALDKYENALNVARRKEDKRSIVMFLSNLAGLKNTMGDYLDALSLSKEAETIAKTTGSITSVAQNKVNQAEAFRYLGQLQNSIIAGQEALNIAIENNLEKFIASANDGLYHAYKDIGRYRDALNNLEQLKDYQIKNGDVLRNKAIAEVEAKFQNVQKQKQILEQEKDILELEQTKAKIERQRNYTIGGSLFIGMLGFFGFRFNKIRKERNDKKAFAEALIFAQEEERKRIARDLHDGIGQSLLLIKKQMESTHENTIDNKRLISETLEEVRTISRDLHPFQLEKFGLTTVINESIDKIASSTQLFITKEIENIDDAFSEKAQINVYRTIQEALSNIIKHAEASAAKVTIQNESGEVLVTIQDNGKGFDLEQSLAESKSLGLRTMYERMSGIGGKFNISKGLSGGTKIELRIPRSDPKIT